MQAPSLELERLMALAVVSAKVRQLLLISPAKALEMLEAGYDGDQPRFTPKERQLLLSIEADTLREFARKLLVKLEGEEAKVKLILVHTNK